MPVAQINLVSFISSYIPLESIRIRYGSSESLKGKLIGIKRQIFDTQTEILILFELESSALDCAFCATPKIADIKPMPGEVSIAVGWLQESYGHVMFNNLQAVQLPVVANKRCIDRFHNGNEFGSNLTFCIQVPKNDTCSLEYGTPLMLYGKLAGMVIEPTDCEFPGSPNFILNLAMYKEWIQKSIS